MLKNCFQLITPNGMEDIADMVDHATSSEDIKAYSGIQALKAYGISAIGTGSRVRGHIDGTLTAYDMAALYQVYQLPTSDSWDILIGTISHDRVRSELKKTFESTQTSTLNYSLDFELQGNDWGITSVFIGQGALLLDYKGQQKLFVSKEPQNSAAVTPDGSPYPGFTPLQPARA